MERSRTSYDALASIVMTVGGCLTTRKTREASAREAAERLLYGKSSEDPPAR
jgi:hypothetical protein